MDDIICGIKVFLVLVLIFIGLFIGAVIPLNLIRNKCMRFG